MKKYFNKIVILVGISILLFTACKKEKVIDEPQLSDYRAKWVGSYDCEENGSRSTVGGTHTTFQYQTIVDVITLEDSLLRITENRNNNSFEMKVDVFGNFSMPLNHGGLTGIFIEKDSIKIDMRSGMLGCATSVTYKGKKLKTN